jgi:hypothetical protein
MCAETCRCWTATCMMLRHGICLLKLNERLHAQQSVRLLLHHSTPSQRSNSSTASTPFDFNFVLTKAFDCPKQYAPSTPSQTHRHTMDGKSNHLEEAQAPHDHSHASSDLASPRQIDTSQLEEVRDQHQISETTSAEIATSTTPTCLSCEEAVIAETAYRAPCEHWYCRSCLEQLFRTALVHEALYPPRCCVALPWDDMRRQLPMQLCLDSNRRMAELDVPAGERVYCAQQACSLLLGDKRALGGTAICLECNLERAHRVSQCRMLDPVRESQTRLLSRRYAWPASKAGRCVKSAGE